MEIAAEVWSWVIVALQRRSSAHLHRAWPAAHIHHANALHLDWQTVVASDRLSYILGNPPFVGKQYRTPEQDRDTDAVFQGVKGVGVLNYVAAWYQKAAQYIQGTGIACSLVSTNSITQGVDSAVAHGLFATFDDLKQNGPDLHRVCGAARRRLPPAAQLPADRAA